MPLTCRDFRRSRWITPQIRLREISAFRVDASEAGPPTDNRHYLSTTAFFRDWPIHQSHPNVLFPALIPESLNPISATQPRASMVASHQETLCVFPIPGEPSVAGKPIPARMVQSRRPGSLLIQRPAPMICDTKFAGAPAADRIHATYTTNENPLGSGHLRHSAVFLSLTATPRIWVRFVICQSIWRTSAGRRFRRKPRPAPLHAGRRRTIGVPLP
jgi:hypothetical protein